LTGKWNAYREDELENWLHEQVCAGQMSLKDVQIQIVINWVETYKRCSVTLMQQLNDPLPPKWFAPRSRF
jgi:hypothetical protein